MPQTFDVIVLGLGGMGSAAAYHLARRKKRVLGIDQFTPGHDKGSSHGKTRVIRQSYFEDPAYVPLLLRAYELWRDLEQVSGERLLFEVGGLMIGTETSSVVSGCLRSARAYHLEHEFLSSGEIARRFPALKPERHLVGVYEKRAGFVLPERCVLAHLKQAAHHGTELHFEEKVLNWTAHPGGEGVRVETTKGVYEASRLVLAPGAWASQVLRDLDLPLEVERQVLYWFESSLGTEPFLPDRFPIFIWETGNGALPYGFPSIDGASGGIKVAFYRAPVSAACTPDTIDRVVHPDEIRTMQETITRLIPSLTGHCLRAVTCMYTNTPDKNFILSRHPRHPQVFVGCGFSGHGFKFAGVIGQVLADLVIQDSTSFDIAFLRPERFVQS
jgi:sarcosine oxidase